EGEIMAILDGVDSRRGQLVNIVDSVFTFDVNGDQAFVYSFKISKDSTDNLSLLNYDLQSSNQSIKLIYLQMDRVDNAKELDGLTYYLKDGNYPGYPENTNFYLHFPEKNYFKWTTSTDFDRVKPSAYYIISRGAWKGKEIHSGMDYMGVSVPSWKDGTEPVMILTVKGVNTLDVYKVF